MHRVLCAVPPLLCALLWKDFAAIVGYAGENTRDMDRGEADVVPFIDGNQLQIGQYTHQRFGVGRMSALCSEWTCRCDCWRRWPSAEMSTEAVLGAIAGTRGFSGSSGRWVGINKSLMKAVVLIKKGLVFVA